MGLEDGVGSLGLNVGCGGWVQFPGRIDRDELFTVNDLEGTYLDLRIGPQRVGAAAAKDSCVRRCGACLRIALSYRHPAAVSMPEQIGGPAFQSIHQQDPRPIRLQLHDAD
jgi:hypothetical protein